MGEIPSEIGQVRGRKLLKKDTMGSNPLRIFIYLLFHQFFLGFSKAELLGEGIIFLIHLFARAILMMKKLKIEETKKLLKLI